MRQFKYRQATSIIILIKYLYYIAAYVVFFTLNKVIDVAIFIVLPYSI